MARLYEELKRRNVFRVAIAYLVTSWVVLQVADILVPLLGLADSASRLILLLLIIGFAPTLLAAWALELTPDGMKLERNIARDESITATTGSRLDRMIVGVLGIAVIILLVDRFVIGESGFDQPSYDATALAARKTVAVLPFVAMSDGQDDEYFADGLTEEILNSLAQIPELLVTARTSAFFFKGKEIPVPEIADVLGVDYVVEGSVRRDGDQLRITAQLIRASDGFHLWSDTYDRSAGARFAIQTEISEKIAATLDIVLDDSARRRMSDVGIRDPEAFITYQEGMSVFALAHGPDASMDLFKRANELFDEVLDKEPGIAEVYVWHADYFFHVLESSNPTEAASAAFRSDYANAIRYAQSEQERARYRTALAIVTAQWTGLADMLDRALADPDCKIANYAELVSSVFGRAREAAAKYRRLTMCDPLAVHNYVYGANMLSWAGNYDDAIEMANAGIEMLPYSTNDWEVSLQTAIVRVLIRSGDLSAAEMYVAQYMPNPAKFLLFQLEAAAGQLDRAREIMADNPESFPDHSSRSLLAAALLGDRDSANQIAAAIDGRDFGHTDLLLATTNCACGAPFDIDVTPNFARMVEESGFDWPPEINRN